MCSTPGTPEVQHAPRDVFDEAQTEMLKLMRQGPFLRFQVNSKRLAPDPPTEVGNPDKRLSYSLSELGISHARKGNTSKDLEALQKINAGS